MFLDPVLTEIWSDPGSRAEDESEEDEPIVIKMIASQMARKNTVQESMQMRSEIEVDQIKLEIARSARKRRAIE
jgi:hypothetical protein